MKRQRRTRTKSPRNSVERLEDRLVLSGSTQPLPDVFQTHTIGDESFIMTWDPPQFETPPSASPLEDGMLLSVSELPALESNPGAPVSLFLDLDGHVEPTWGFFRNVTTPVYDIDGDATTFNETEIERIYTAWHMVAEDYRPFNVNVTTVEPAVLAEGVPASQANGVALRVAIGGSWDDWFGSESGGVGYLNSFTSSMSNVVYAFTDYIGANFGGVCSHEAGHGFGLYHQSLYDENGVKIDEYHDGEGNWAPIMGGSYYPASRESTWHNGTSSQGADVFQNDMALLSGSLNGFGYRADDHGDDSAAATPLPTNSSLLPGIIETNDDVDVFRISPTTSGDYFFRVDVDSVSPNLDAVLELKDSAGAVIAAAAPENELGAELVGKLTAGEDYDLHVTKTDTYGYVGQYSVSAFAIANGPQVVASSPSARPSLSELKTIRVTFADPVDVTSFDTEDVVLTGPLGPIAIDGVTVDADTNDTRFTIAFPPQTAHGRYELVLGPHVFDLAGNPMNQDQDTVSGEPDDDQFTTSIYLGTPRISISDAEVVEGDAGTQELLFTVIRERDPSVEFSVDYATANDSATAAGMAGTTSFSRRIVKDSFDIPTSVFPADLDGDGDQDLITSDWNTAIVAWHENDGAGNFTMRMLDEHTAGTSSVFATDVDGDGDNDVLAASYYYDEIVLARKRRHGHFTQHMIPNTADGPVSVYAIDIDDDGDRRLPVGFRTRRPDHLVRKRRLREFR